MSNPSSENLTLYRGWLDTGRYVWSPFVIKLEARLRFANVPYKSAVGSPRTGPKGKIPYVEINNEASSSGSSIGDSTLIIKHLVERNVLPDLQEKLSPTDRAHDLALRALLEDKVYFYNMRERWLENFYTMRDHVLSAIPYPMRIIVGLLAHRGAVQTLHGQGTGRFSADEVQVFRQEIWETLNGLLAEAKEKSKANASASADDTRPFWVLGGDEPTEADATVFGFIVSVFVCTAAPESRKLVVQLPAVREYAKRIHDTYFPDYEMWSEE